MGTNLRVLVGIAFCAAAALILSFIMGDAESRLAAPIVCTFPVIAASFRWGRAAAILGGLAASLIFELFLFPPIGSLYVNDPAERLALVLLACCAVVASLMSPPQPTDGTRRKNFEQGE